MLEFLAIDMAWHTDADLTDFKLEQARQIEKSVTAEHQPTLVADVKELSRVIVETPNQLFVQAFLMIELIMKVIQISTLYYCQRMPEELGHFHWVIDRKDSKLTAMERLWTLLIAPVGMNRSLKEPFTTLKEGDYSHFDRFRVPAEADEIVETIKWMDKNLTYAKPPNQRGIIDMKQVLQKSFKFADSKEELGLQLADIVASACRRAFNGNLLQSGWEKLGQLLVKKNGKPPIIGMRTKQQSIGCDLTVREDAAAVWLTLDSRAKSMWT